MRQQLVNLVSDMVVPHSKFMRFQTVPIDFADKCSQIQASFMKEERVGSFPD
jgi:hypothetical protein